MDHGEDARAKELHDLRLALATFALQLDAFELRASGALLAEDNSLGKNDWASTKSHGSKSDT
jgi:hypothetical protein